MLSLSTFASYSATCHYSTSKRLCITELKSPRPESLECDWKCSWRDLKFHITTEAVGRGAGSSVLWFCYVSSKQASPPARLPSRTLVQPWRWQSPGSMTQTMSERVSPLKGLAGPEGPEGPVRDPGCVQPALGADTANVWRFPHQAGEPSHFHQRESV